MSGTGKIKHSDLAAIAVVYVLAWIVLGEIIVNQNHNQNIYSLAITITFSLLSGSPIYSSPTILQALFIFYNTQVALLPPYVKGLMVISFWGGAYLVLIVYSKWRTKGSRAGAFYQFQPP